MIVRELITKLGFNLDSTQLNRADKKLGEMVQHTDRLSSSIRNLVGAFLGFQSIKSIVAIGDEMQSLRARIAQLPTTIGDAGVAFDVVAARASNAKQSVDAYSTFFIKAGNATQDYVKDQETLLKIVDGAAFGLAASGATAVAQKQAFFQLGQAIGSPVVQMEEMNTLIDVAPDLFRELGKVIPGAEGNLKKFVGTGKVTGRMLAEGLVKAADVFEQKMKKMPLTVGTAFVLIKNRFGLMIDRMNRESLFITRIADTFLAVFDRIENGITGLITYFGGFENAIRLVGIAVSVALGAKAIKILMAFNAASLAALLPWALIAAGIALATLLLEDLYIWISGGDSVTGKLIGPWLEWRDSVLSAIENIKSGFLTMMRIVTFGLSDIFLKMLDNWGKNIFSVIYNAIINSVKAAWAQVTGIFSGVFDSVQKTAGMLNTGGNYGTGAMQMAPSQLAPSAMGAGRPNISNNTNVNVTVPKGTTDEQVKFIQSAAQQSFAKVGDSKFARDLSTYTP